MRAPVAAKTALAIAAAISVIDSSPAPVAATSVRSITFTSTSGTAKPSDML